MTRLDSLPFSRATAIALVAGLSGVAGSFVAVGRSPTFVATPVARFLSRTMPGEIVAFAVTTLGNLGQQLNFLTAIVIVALLIAALTFLSIAAGRSLGQATAVGATLFAGVATWTLALALSGDPLAAIAVGAPVAIVVGLGQLSVAMGRRDPLSSKRRRALSTIGAAIGVAGVGYAGGRTRSPPTTSEDAPVLEGPNVDQAAIQSRLQAAADAELPEDDLDPLVSDRFYEVDINSVDPDLDAGDWSLSITGAVEREVTVDYAALQSMTTENRFATLRCVGESLNGQKMDTALWTGVPVRRLLEQATPQSGCECVMLRAADGYYEEFPLPALEPGLLAYGMNGDVLPRGHGYPVRALVPGHWGEVNVKWLTEIEVLEREATGFWEERGWHGTGPVVPVAKLHTVEDHPDGRLLGGHAYAGTRGVSAVEVSTDGGSTWTEARLSDPLPDADVWRQWAYVYDPPEPGHEVVVRMIDGDGDVQPREERGPYPNGPSGWVTQRI